MRLVLPPRSAWGKQSRCHRQSPTKAANEAGCEQARFLSGVHMGKEWACVPKFGRSLAHQLSAKGLTKVSPGENPDVLVSDDVVFDRDIRGMGFRDGLRNLRWRSGSHDVLMGMLVVNLVDSGTRVMVWRGMASGKVDANASPEKHDKKIHEVVQKIFRSYPPKE